MSRSLVYIILGCASASLHAHADWDYPVSAQLAMYDAIEHRCGPVDRATLRQKHAEMVKRFSPEERAEMKNARQSAQYREVLAGASQELAQMIARAGEDGESKICKEMIQRI